MYPISNEARKLFADSLRQVADIRFYGLDEEIHITDKDIVQGGLSLNRYCVSGSKIEIGSVIAGEIELRLNNSDGRFNNVKFEGAELFVQVGVKKWGAAKWENAVYHYIPFGYFTVDEAPRKLEVITLTALDRMMLFDKPVDMSKLSFPTTVEDLTIRICEICNVTLKTDLSTLPNHDYVIKTAPTTEDLTYRQILSWIAEITGTCGFMDWDGQLNLKWYTATDTVIDLKDRFDSDLQENAVQITGVQIVDDEEYTYLAGTADYAFNIEGNELIQNDPLSVAQSINAVVGGFSYIPVSATVKPMPHLYPLDMISFVDKSGNKHSSIITDYTFVLNASTQIEGKGETAAKTGYATANPLTKRESLIINKMHKDVNRQLNSREQYLLSLNETIVNSLGLYRSEETAVDGSTIYYYHDKPTKESSGVIYTFRAGGFAWTNDWNDGSPVWQSGMDRNGNAVLQVLSSYKISADQILADSITADKIKVDDLKIKKVYSQNGKICLSEVVDEWLSIGGDGTWNYSSVKIYAGLDISIGEYASYNRRLYFSTITRDVHPGLKNDWDLGTIDLPFGHIRGEFVECEYVRCSENIGFTNATGGVIASLNGTSIGESSQYWDNAYISKIYLASNCYLDASFGKLRINGTAIGEPSPDMSGEEVKMGGDSIACIVATTAKELRPSSSSSIYTFSLGSSSYYWDNAYADKIYLRSGCYLSANNSNELCVNGTSIMSAVEGDLSNKDVKFGGSASTYIIANTSRELRPSSSSTSYDNTCYLGTSSYYWQCAYIGSDTVKIGSTTSSKVGFFNGTATRQQTLSTTSQNMSFSSATSSNYLTILNNLVGILKKYGLITT